MKRDGSGQKLLKVWHQFVSDLTLAIDAWTCVVCRATGQPIPSGVRRRAMKYRRSGT